MNDYPDSLEKIPSEFIEPYLIKMLSIELECIEFRPTEERLEEAKQNLKGVERFINRFGGIHSSLAISNVYRPFYELTLEQALDICKRSFKERFDDDRYEK